MFQVGDYVIYGNNGVCRIENVGPMEMMDMPKERLYYTLAPVSSNAGKIFTPVDNAKVVIRAVITREEAQKLIDDIKDIDELWIADERRRENVYKEAMAKCDLREFVKIIKTIYLRKQSRIAAGKKLTAADERYFHMAEESLYGELAIPLEMEKEEVKKYVVAKVKEKETVKA